MSDATSRRKRDHLVPFLRGGVPPTGATTWLECVRLVHMALPEVAAEEVDLSATFCGHRLEAPFLVTGMSGGTAEARDLNRAVAAAADRLGLAFGLGSQRAMVEKPELTATYEVRDVAPRVFLVGNLGAVQAAAMPVVAVREMLDRVGADALAVHLNAAQELIQPEGDRDFRGLTQAIGRLARELGRPVMVKEVGCGIGREAGIALRDAGVRHVDVAGCGGTSFVRVEAARAGRDRDPEAVALRDWGIPTAAAVAEVAPLGFEVVASGGIRTGLDTARAIALGATIAGVAAPVVTAWAGGGQEAVERLLTGMIEGLRDVMVLCGCRTLAGLRAAPRVVLDPLRTWIADRTATP